MMVPLNLRIYCYPRGHSLFLSPHPSLSDLCQGHGTSAHGLQGDGHDQECHHDAHHVHVPDSQLPLKGEDWNEEFRRWEIWNLKKLFRFFCFSCQNTFLLRHWVLSRAGWRWQCSRPPWTGWTWYTARPARCPSCFCPLVWGSASPTKVIHRMKMFDNIDSHEKSASNVWEKSEENQSRQNKVLKFAVKVCNYACMKQNSLKATM